MLEIEALAEIYERNVFSHRLNAENGEISGEFIAHHKFTSYESIKIVSGNKTVTVTHIPPIHLKFIFNSYDVESLPKISVTSIWIPRRLLLRLNSILDDIIIKNEESRLWLCCEYLENEALKSIFQITDDGNIEIILEDLYPLESDTNLDDHLKFLSEYNINQDESVFNNLIVECEVCMIAMRGVECNKFSSCTHIVCTNCIIDHFNTRISMGFLNLSCAVCGEELEYVEVRRVMDAQSFERWDTLSARGVVKSLEDHRCCKRCQRFIAIDPADGYGFCRDCRHTFCLDCNETFNGPKCCHNLTVEDEEAKEQRRINRDLHTKSGRKKFREKHYAEIGKVENLKVCPTCGLPFEKNGGCNHMTCPSCGTHFCYLCCCILKPSDPYAHFVKKCKLFEMRT